MINIIKNTAYLSLFFVAGFAILPAVTSAQEFYPEETYYPETNYYPEETYYPDQAAYDYNNYVDYNYNDYNNYVDYTNYNYNDYSDYSDYNYVDYTDYSDYSDYTYNDYVDYTYTDYQSTDYIDYNDYIVYDYQTYTAPTYSTYYQNVPQYTYPTYTAPKTSSYVSSSYVDNSYVDYSYTDNSYNDNSFYANFSNNHVVYETKKESVKTPSCDLTASDTRIDEGDEVTLRWEADDADEVKLKDNRSHTFFSRYIGGEDSGRLKVEPTRDTTYTLVVTNDDKERDCEVTIDVEDEERVVVREVRTYEPTSGIYLKDAPYTGVDSATVITYSLYGLLTLWALYAAYYVAVRKSRQPEVVTRNYR